MKSSVLVTVTPKLSESLEFYNKLGFQHHESHGQNYFVDGDTIIEIDSSRMARAGIKLFKDKWNEEVEELKKITEVFAIENGYLLNDFSGIRIQLIEGVSNIKLEDNEVSKSKLGTIAGLSLEGISIKQMNKIYKILGFEKTMGDEDSSWMAVMNEDGLGISMMGANTCPHLFYNPSLTYFNGKENLSVIKNIRDAGIPIKEEITVFNEKGIVDNVIVQDPGGFGFFVFSD